MIKAPAKERVTEEQRAKASRAISALQAERDRRNRLRDESEQGRKSFRKFIEMAWNTVEPSRPLVPNWHIDAIADHLQAVKMGHIQQLGIAMPPGHLKPVWEQEFVVERTRGRIQLASVLVGDDVLTHKGRFRRVTGVYDQGELPLISVKTHCGRVVRAAEDHPFLTPRGWIQVKDLTESDVLASVHATEACGTDGISAEEARFLGYMIGDGSCAYYPSFTNQDEGVLSDFEKCAKHLGFYTTRVQAKNTKGVRVNLRAWETKKGSLKHTNRLTDFFKRHGLHGVDSYQKRVPQGVLSSSAPVIAEFIGAYWSCDGFISSRGESRTDVCIGCDSVSEDLMRDIQHLLVRVGIQSRVRRKTMALKTSSQPGGIYVSWSLSITNLDHGSRFAQTIPIAHEKSEKLPRYIRSGFDRVLNEDPIVSISQSGSGRCRCLSVEEDCSFTANDIAVHNSVEVAVLWPAWYWLDDPFYRGIFASYSGDLSVRDSLRCRDLVESDFYRGVFEPDWSLSKTAEDYFINTRKGSRFSTSVEASGTGFRGDLVVVDDPLKAGNSRSPAALERCIFWWDQEMSSRFNDKTKGSKVIVMQRLAENDLLGHCLKRGGYTYLRLPTEFEPADKTITILGPGKMWQDPRTTAGELLFPAMFPRETVDKIKFEELGSYGFTCQHQQRVTPATGGTLKTFYWHYWKPRGMRLPQVQVKLENGSIEMREAVDLPLRFDELIQSWDMTFKDTKASDFVVGLIAAALQSNRYILDLTRERMDFAKTCTAVKILSAKHPNAITKIVEDKANGPAVISALKQQIGGFVAVNPEGSKFERASAALPLLESGNWYLPHPDLAAWVPIFIAECGAFGAGGTNDDQVDAWSQAAKRLRNHIAKFKKPVQALPWDYSLTSRSGSWMV